MSRILSTRDLDKYLKAEGFPLPDDCAEIRLLLGVNKPFILQYDIFVSGENLARLGRAFVKMAERDTWREPKT